MRHQVTRGRLVSVWLLTIFTLLFATRSIAPAGPGSKELRALPVVEELPAKRVRTVAKHHEPPVDTFSPKRKNKKKDGRHGKTNSARKDSVEPTRAGVHVTTAAWGLTRTDDIAVRAGLNCCMSSECCSSI
jgi:hypothetical protein